MISPENYILITHNQPEITTFGQLFQGNVVLLKDITPNELINYRSLAENDNQYTNRARIFLKYTKEEKEKYANYSASALPLKLGTRLALPKDKVVQESLFQYDFNTTKYFEVKPFLSDRLAELIRDVKYVRATPLSETIGHGVTKKILPHITVFVWCRALDKVLNISPFITNLQTNSSMEGASFSFRLAPILGVYDFPSKMWKINESSITNYFHGGIRTDYVAKSYISRENPDGSRRRPPYFFNQVIASNDLVFIRFETLEIEKEKRLKESQNFEIGLDELPGNIYDMIGLVDTNNVSMSASFNDIAIDITGRDATKLIIDDGTLFFPLEYASGVIYNAGERDIEEGKLLSRSFTSGKLLNLNAYLYRSIDFSMKFIMNQMSSTGIIPNEVFKHFPNRSTRYRLQKTQTQSERDNLEPVLKEAEGLWSIINLIVDPSVQNRRIADDSIAMEQGSIINFINRFCQKPFVEFYTDTYGDRFTFIVKQQPFDKVKLRGMVYDEIVTEEKVISGDVISSTYDRQQVDNLSDRQFREDTGREDLANVLPEITVRSEPTELTKIHKEYRVSDILLTVKDEDVYNENLSFSDNEVYSFYTINPQSFMFGNEQLALYYFPAVAFPEYQEIYGTKPYSLSSIYHIYEAYQDAQSAVNLNVLERQIFYDLRYMIESTMYLPFTRSGSITINGDRRIKKGTFIYYEPTNEVYYVNNVSHVYDINNSSVDRFTVLNVERGMVLDYVKETNELLFDDDGNDIGRHPVSYFNIINLEIDESVFQIKRDYVGDDEETINTEQKSRFHNAIKDWHVNKPVFKFFQSRRQFKR